MSNKNYKSITGIIFLVIASLHLTRLILGWEAVIGGWMIPLWVSWVALVVSGYLFYSAFKK